MNLETIAQQSQSGGLDQSRALKNAVLLRKLQSMDPETRQRVIAMAQQKRRARTQPQGQPQQMQQRQPIPQGQLQQRQPIQPQQIPQGQPMPQGGQVNPDGFRRLAMQQQRPSLAQQLQQRPQIGR